jgi:aryl-alcohol dehydrogenase-like predicted oxidoreductase
MEYTRLGRTALKVSRLCLGTMNFGPHTNEKDSHAIMDRALEAGINFFDTADIYGWGENRGNTERIIGTWFAQGGGRREKVVIATKCYNEMWEGPNGKGLSAYHIRRACEDSLRRLQTDHIDLYQMHHIDRTAHWEEIWQAMEQLVRDGKVLYIGGSNFPGWHIAEAQGYARERHFMGLVCEQGLYNLRARTVELEVLPACERFGLGFIPWSPLDGGALGGMLKDSDKDRRNREHMQKRLAEHRDKFEKFEAFCDELGQQPAMVALAWLLHQKVVTAPIIGPRTMKQLDETLPAVDLKLDQGALKRLDEIWPGPGGPAPEAYSW